MGNWLPLSRVLGLAGAVLEHQCPLGETRRGIAESYLPLGASADTGGLAPRSSAHLEATNERLQFT